MEKKIKQVASGFRNFSKVKGRKKGNVGYLKC